MSSPLISIMRDTSLFMRSTASTVLITFVMLLIQPTIAAAQNTQTSPAPPPISISAEQQYSKTIQRIEDKLDRLAQKLAQQHNGSAEKNQLKQLHQTLVQLDRTVMQGFRQIEQHITDKTLASVIMDRHLAMVTNYQNEYQALINELDALDNSSNDAQRQLHAQAALNRLKSKRHKRSQQPFNPAELPNRTLPANPDNKPKENKAAFIQAGLDDTPHVKLTALGDFTFDKLNGASNPAYLTETDEIILSQAIKDQAVTLNHDPVEIYHWVRNNIEWQPTWGAIQNAELTLSAQRGNAMDIASLTLALLRASKIPARYVHGTIDVPVVAFQNWVGGFSDMTAAANFAASGGIPVTSVTSGGQITKIRIEHIWVEAAIDFQPSRGAINKDADSWVVMDPSYKQYDYLQGLDVIQISGIDPQQLAQDFIDSGTVNQSENWVTGFDASILQNAQAQAQVQLENHIQNNLNNPTVGDVIGGRKTIIQQFPTLPSSLPNKIVVSGSRYDQLPKQLQQTITWSLGNGNSISFPFAKTNNQKITLSFKPETLADEQALLSLLPAGQITDISQLPTSIPSYLVNVIPELKLNGQAIKTGSAMKLGEELDFITATSFAGRGQIQSPRTYKVIAGSYLAVNAYAGSVSPQILQNAQTKLQQTKTILETADQQQISALTRQELLGDMFHAGGLGYYAQLNALSYIMGLQSGGHFTLAAGTGTFGYEPNVDYFFGVPRSIKPGGIALDIPIASITATNDGNIENKKQFTLQTGILSSALEHAVPEQMFVNTQNPGEAISAVKALQKASQLGQRIYQITPANQSAILGNIHHDPSTMADIRNALNAGREVITHTDAVSVPGWTGAGYIVFDPLTGDGAYLISGGGNGAELFVAGFIQGISLSLVFFIATFISTVAAGAIWFLWFAVFLIVLANVLVVLDNLERYENNEQWRSCYLGGLMTGLGVSGLGKISALIGRLITSIALIMGFTVNTSFYGGCNEI